MTAILTSFVGARLREPIPFNPRRLHDGRTIADINLTSEEIDEMTCLDLEDNDEPSTAYAGKARTHTYIDHFNEMRTHVDKNDPLLFAQVVAPRKYRTRVTPKWVMSKTKVQQLLLAAFPRMYEDSEAGRRQRHDAERWALVINLYFRMKYTAAQIAEELYGYSRIKDRKGRRYVPGTPKIRGIIQAIQRKIKTIETGNARQRGRPPRNSVTVEII